MTLKRNALCRFAYRTQQGKVRRFPARRSSLTPLAAALIGLALSSPILGQATGAFTGLGTLGGAASTALDVSADGAVVVGYSYPALYSVTRAFRWTSGTMSDLGTLGGAASAASGVSADGAVVVGQSDLTGNSARHAFRWTGGTMSDLGTLGGTNSYAYGASADGAVVVGQSNPTGDSAWHAFRWTGGTMSDLHTLGGINSYAYDVSADGAVVVGQSDLTGNSAMHAFRWTGGTMSDLGTLGGAASTALGVSADGAVVVGQSDLTGNSADHAFRWMGGTMSDLGTLGGTVSAASGVSADGAVVVGWSYLTGNSANHAFRWTEPGGMQDVSVWLGGAGVMLPTGWTLANAMGVNQDGTVLVGYGTNPASYREAWLARVSPNGSGVLTNIPAYNASLVEAGLQRLHSGLELPNMALFGVHHRSLLDYGLVRGTHGLGFWATGDFGRYHEDDTNSKLAEVGVSMDVAWGRLGLGMGQARVRQAWSLGGGGIYNGHFVTFEAANAFGGGWEGSLLGYYGRFHSDLTRHYLNGASVDASTGEPDAQSTAARARLDWKQAVRLDAFSFSPYLAYTWVQTTMDGYTETGGGFPARFDASDWDVSDLRLGLVTQVALTASTDLKLTLEGVRRNKKNAEGVRGQVIGLWSFSLPGKSECQDWGRAIADLDYRLSRAWGLASNGAEMYDKGTTGTILTPTTHSGTDGL